VTWLKPPARITDLASQRTHATEHPLSLHTHTRSWRMLKQDVRELARKGHLASVLAGWRAVAQAGARKEQQRRAGVRHRWACWLNGEGLAKSVIVS